MHRSAPLRKACAVLIASFVAVMCVAPPCAAGEPQPAPARTPSLAKLSPASVSLLARATQRAQSSGSETSSFFKTPKGVAVLVLIGAGFGYTLYSKSHDRVMSPVR
jgi:hypothetical protein